MVSQFECFNSAPLLLAHIPILLSYIAVYFFTNYITCSLVRELQVDCGCAKASPPPWVLRHYFPGQLELNAADSPTRSQPRSRAGDLWVSIFLCSMFVIPRPSADARPRARDPNSVVSDEGVYACPLSVGTPIIRHTMHYRSTVEACAATYH